MSAVVVNRFLLAAVVDRLVFADEATFQASDARQLAELLPREARSSFLGRFISAGVDASISGGLTRGHAAGVGDVDVRDDKPHTTRWMSGEHSAVRAGQGKLRWAGPHIIEIEQVADVGPMTRTARLRFNRDDTPRDMMQMGHVQWGRSWSAHIDRGRSRSEGGAKPGGTDEDAARRVSGVARCRA